MFGGHGQLANVVSDSSLKEINHRMEPSLSNFGKGHIWKESNPFKTAEELYRVEKRNLEIHRFEIY